MGQADMATGDLDADAPIGITRRPVDAYLDSHSTIVAPGCAFVALRLVPSPCRPRAPTEPPVRTARASHGPQPREYATVGRNSRLHCRYGWSPRVSEEQGQKPGHGRSLA